MRRARSIDWNKRKGELVRIAENADLSYDQEAYRLENDLRGSMAIVLGRCPNPHYVKLLVGERPVPVFEDFVEVLDEKG